MFMLIIWLQGIWLPLHGYDFARTPLWAGHLHAAAHRGVPDRRPVSGILSDRFGARPFATGGMLATASRFVLLELLPGQLHLPGVRPLLFCTAWPWVVRAPNRAGVMNSLPPEHRGAGSGMNSTFQNSAQVLSIGIFFTLMIVGLSASLPRSLYHGLVAHGVLAAAATPGVAPAAGVDAVRRLPRVQPDAAPARCVGARPPARRAAAVMTGPVLLPHR